VCCEPLIFVSIELLLSCCQLNEIWIYMLFFWIFKVILCCKESHINVGIMVSKASSSAFFCIQVKHPLAWGNQLTARIPSEEYHMDITTIIYVTRLARQLDGNIREYIGGRNVIVWGLGGIQPWSIFLWPQYSHYRQHIFHLVFILRNLSEVSHLPVHCLFKLWGQTENRV
jgi:hypothetical protein